MNLRPSVLWLLPLVLTPAALIPGCSSDDEGETPGTGGVSGLGGFTATGGAFGTGGVPPGTGGIPVGTGGVPPGTGGIPVGTGGVPGAGGGPGAGGVPVGPGEYTFQTGRFSVGPGKEVYKCQDFANPFGGDVAVVEMTTELTPGSHHMFAFVIGNAEATLQGSLHDCPGGGVEFHEYLTTSGTPTQNVKYPANIGRVFVGGAALRINVHLVNTSDEAKDAFASFKVRYVDPASLEYRAAAIFLNNVSLQVRPGRSTATKSYQITEDITMLGAASHMHSRGVQFTAKASSGETLYEGTEWAEPPPKVFTPPLLLKAGTTITWSCTYQNETNRNLGFGESASTDEMCIFPGEFYNKNGNQISYQAF